MRICPRCRFNRMAPNAKFCHSCAALRKRVKDRAFSAARRARIRRMPRLCPWPGCTVNLRGTRRQRCPEHGLRYRNDLRSHRRAVAIRDAEIRAEEELQAVVPWNDIVRSECES